MISLTEIPNQSSMFINLFIHLLIYLFIYLFVYLFKLNQIKFSCTDNITARNSKTKCYEELHLSGCSGGLRTGIASIFVWMVLNLILWTFYINYEL